MRSVFSLKIPVLLVFELAFLLSPCFAQSADIPEAAQSAYAQGVQAERAHTLNVAMDSFNAALKLSGGHSLPCLEAIERVQMEMENYKDAAGTAQKMAAASVDAKEKAHAKQLEGQAFYREYFAYTLGEGVFEKNPKRAADALKQAEAALRDGVALDASNEPVRMLHGRVLAAMKRDEDASKEFAACAATPGASPAECARALQLARHVDAARAEPAPAFEVKGLDGRRVTLDALAGKVVLVDFWATWCTYCRRDSDYVQSMLDSFDKDQFLLLEVDVDEDAGLWKSYVKDNRLEGLQTRDDKMKSLQTAFHVSGFPTYLVLDGNGTIRFRTAGAQGDLRGTIRKLIAEQAAAKIAGDARETLPKTGSE